MEDESIVERPFAFCPVLGSVNSFDPSASPAKFATVFGTSWSKRRTLKFPSLVVNSACIIDPSYTIAHVGGLSCWIDVRFLLSGLSSLRGFRATAACRDRALQNPTFPKSPFTLGVGSGDPSPDGVVLWTRLALDPLNGGGMPRHADRGAVADRRRTIV